MATLYGGCEDECAHGEACVSGGESVVYGVWPAGGSIEVLAVSTPDRDLHRLIENTLPSLKGPDHLD